MKIDRILSQTWKFLKLHRVVVLIVTVIFLATVFSIYMLARGRHFEPTFMPVSRSTPKVSIGKGLPPKPLERWGADPFRDVLKELEIARINREEMERIRAEKIAREKAEREERERVAREVREKALKEAEERAEAQRRLQEQQEKERQARKKVIQAIRIDGILFDPKGNSSAIIEGKPQVIGDTIVKNGVSALVEEINANNVVFKDAKSGDNYRVPLSR